MVNHIVVKAERATKVECWVAVTTSSYTSDRPLDCSSAIGGETRFDITTIAGAKFELSVVATNESGQPAQYAKVWTGNHDFKGPLSFKLGTIKKGKLVLPALCEDSRGCAAGAWTVRTTGKRPVTIARGAMTMATPYKLGRHFRGKINKKGRAKLRTMRSRFSVSIRINIAKSENPAKARYVTYPVTVKNYDRR